MSVKILVVDADPDVCHLVDVRLSREGYTVIAVESAEQALASLASERPDLMISEILLPEMDGLELTRQVKSLSDAPLVLLLTGMTADTDISNGFTAGADDYITKPFSPLVLIERVRVALIRAGRATPAMQTVGEDDND